MFIICFKFRERRDGVRNSTWPFRGQVVRVGHLQLLAFKVIPKVQEIADKTSTLLVHRACTELHFRTDPT